MSLADNLRKEHGVNNTLTLAQSLRKESARAQQTSIERAKKYDRYALAKTQTGPTKESSLPTFSQVEKEFSKHKGVGLNTAKNHESTGNVTTDYVLSKLTDREKGVAEKEALDAVQKVKNRPWYVPKPIAVMIENSKLGKDAKILFAQKNSDAQSKSAGGVYANSLVDSASVGLKPTLQKVQAKKLGATGEAFLKQQAEAKANHPVADTLGTISGYLAPGTLAEKGASIALKPVLAKVGSKVAQKAIAGGVSAGGMELAEGVIRGEKPKDIVKRTVAGAGFGAAGDVAFYGAGKGISSIANKIKAGKVLTTAEKEIVKNTPELLPKLAKETPLPTIDANLPTNTISKPVDIMAHKNLAPKLSPTTPILKKPTASKSIDIKQSLNRINDTLSNSFKFADHQKKNISSSFEAMINDMNSSLQKGEKKISDSAFETFDKIVSDMIDIQKKTKVPNVEAQESLKTYKKFADYFQNRKINYDYVHFGADVAEKMKSNGHFSSTSGTNLDTIWDEAVANTGGVLNESNFGFSTGTTEGKYRALLQIFDEVKTAKNASKSLRELSEYEIADMIKNTSDEAMKVFRELGQEFKNIAEAKKDLPPSLLRGRLNTPNTIVAEKKIPTLKYKPEPSLKTDLTKPKGTMNIIEKPSEISGGVKSTFFKVDSDLMDVSGHIPNNNDVPFIDNIWYNSKMAPDVTDKSTIPKELLGKGNATKHVLSVLDYFKGKGKTQFEVKIMSDDSYNLLKSMERKGYVKQLSEYKYDGDNVLYEILNPKFTDEALPKPLNKVVMDTPKTKSDFTQSLSDLRTKVVDKNLPITKFSKVANDKTGMLASNTSNSNGTVDYILKDALVDRQGKKIGSSLKDVADQIPKGKEKDFWEYMSQRHNIDRAREGKNVIANYTSEMSDKAVKQIEATHPEWKATGDNVTNWIDAFMREWGVNAGTVDSEVYDGLRETYKSYFPTQREFSQLEKSIPNDVRKQFVDSASPIGKATGSERDIHNPISNIMNLVNRTVKTAKYNEVGQSLLDSVRNQPDKLRPLAEVIKPKDGMFSNVDNVVTVLENGKPVYLQINDKALLDSLKGLPKVVNNAQAMRKISNVYKSLITQKNPLFAIRNMARDIPTAYIYGSETNPVKFTGGLLKAGKDIITNSDGLKRYKAVGGGGVNFLSGDADKAAKILLKKPNLLQKAGGAIETFNNLTETAPRLAEFNRIFEKTGDIQKALAAANDVTVNFARGGNVTKSLDPFVPYLNASVQGLDKFFRQVKNKPLQTLVKSGIAITAPEVALYLVNKDDPNYQELDNRTKDTYFLIPKGDGTFTKIPKSRELGVLFGSLFQRIERAKEGDKEAFKGFGNALATGFAPTNPFENNIFAPAVLNIPKNKDFAGRAIVPMNMQMDKRSKYLQYDERTTEIAKAIGNLSHKATGGEGLSPKQIDYIIKSYTGVIGQLGIPAATKGGAPGKVITSQFIADPIYSNQTIQDFYDNYTKVQKKAADKNILDKIPSQQLTAEESIEGKFRKASSKISDLNKQIRNAKGDEAAIKELRKQIVIIAKEANDMLK